MDLSGNPNLVVPGVRIHKTEEITSYCGIDIWSMRGGVMDLSGNPY